MLPRPGATRLDLVLGQGMLNAGWNAHKLNAPGKFLVSAPEHDIPRRARAYLVTDEMVAVTAARHSLIPRELDEISRNAMVNVSRRHREFGRSTRTRKIPPITRGQSLAGAVHRTRRGMGNRRPHEDDRNAEDNALPAPTGASPARATPTRSAVAGGAPATPRMVTVSDRPIVPPSRASARNGRDGTLELHRKGANGTGGNLAQRARKGGMP